MNEDKKKAYILSHVVAESIISSMEDIFAVLDLEGKVQFVNETFQRILGYGEEDIVGQVLLEYFFSPEDDFMFEGRQSAVLTDNEFVKNYNIGIKAKNEKIMPFNISMTPIFNKDKEMIGTAFIGRDMRQMINILRQLKEINITLEEKVKERTNELEEANQILKDAQSKLVLSEKMSAMSLLAGGISHEISNPIMAIIGFADMLMSSEDDEGNRLKLQKIKNFAFNCMDIINKFCDFAMKPGTEFEDISINQVIEDTLLLAKNKLKYDVDVIKDLQSDLPRIKGESNELQNVFINIILNAKDAMPEGGRLYVRTYLQNSRVFVSIRDTGKGIPQNLIEKIFEAFFTTKESRGTGLGLSVGQEIIKAHGGNIAVESEEGKGTSVIVCFPIPEKAEDRKQATEDRLK